MPENSPHNGQAGVEITPGMIKAGFDVLLDYESDELHSHEVVERVYRAMRKVGIRSRVGALERTG